MSKRRLTIENSTPNDEGTIAVPKKRNKPSENASTAEHNMRVPLMNDWNAVFNCLITSVPVDETIPTKMNEPFPIIEYTFDDTDIIESDCS